MIKAAAIRTKDGLLTKPPPARHADIARLLQRIGGHEYPWIEGFVDQDMRFMDRKEAMQHARACGQLKPRNQPADPLGAKPRITEKDELYSEDLW